MVTSVTDPLLAFGLLGGLVGVGAMSLLFGFLFAGAQRRDALYVRSRRLAREATWRDRLVAAVGGLLLVAVLASFGWLWWWLGAAVVAVGLGMVWAKVVDRGARGDCEPMVRRAEMAVREMRENGVDETRVRRAVAEAGGARWEPFYEALFGYEAKLAARGIYGTDGRGSAGAWRDPLAAWLDARLDGRRARRDERLLTQAAAGELVARGVPEAAAERQAINQARRELAKAHLLREQIRAELRRELRREAAGEEKPAADAAGSPEPSPAAGDHGAGGGGGPGDGKIRPKPVKYTDDDFRARPRKLLPPPLRLAAGPAARPAGAVRAGRGASDLLRRVVQPEPAGDLRRRRGAGVDGPAGGPQRPGRRRPRRAAADRRRSRLVAALAKRHERLAIARRFGRRDALARRPARRRRGAAAGGGERFSTAGHWARPSCRRRAR